MAVCKGCGAQIAWAETPKGARMPTDPDGTPHWATCPVKDRFKRPRPAKAEAK